ncbi:hypothetical protein [Nocardioides sp. Leaf374]|uniref:hypothetical protein n=1 Tax=Nocardioides sp. Leaf374 TaxID=2876560 RepID=UPI001E451568|nr:hypothetical protein [Nocardioides sp. Leaf374]
MTDPDLWLTPGRDAGPAIDALVSSYGGRRAGLAGLVVALPREGRRLRRTLSPGLAARRSWTWQGPDRRDPRWWPQGVTSSADAAAGAAEAPVPGRVLMVSWYAKTMPGEPTPPGGQGSRISVVDLETRRYDHVLLVRAQADGSWKPLQVHAGGIAWVGSWLHVAATAKGFWSARVDDVVEVPAGRRAETFGHRWVLPVRRGHAAGSGEGVEPLRYSFLSVDASPASPASSSAAPAAGPELVVGEYARGRRTRRLARFALSPEGAPVVGDDGRARPLSVHDSGVAGMQGAVVSRGRWHVTTSHGPWTPGTLVTGASPDAADPWRPRRWATPMGPEDLAVWPGDTPADDRLWTVTEHPRRRWICELRVPR